MENWYSDSLPEGMKNTTQDLTKCGVKKTNFPIRRRIFNFLGAMIAYQSPNKVFTRSRFKLWHPLFLSLPISLSHILSLSLSRTVTYLVALYAASNKVTVNLGTSPA